MSDLEKIMNEAENYVTIQRCMSQIFRPNQFAAARKPGKGHCYECTYDPVNNPRCSGYRGIGITYVNVDQYTRMENG